MCLSSFSSLTQTRLNLRHKQLYSIFDHSNKYICSSLVLKKLVQISPKLKLTEIGHISQKAKTFKFFSISWKA